MEKSGYGRDGIFRSLKPKLHLPDNPNLSLVDFLFDQIPQIPLNKPALIDSQTSASVSFHNLKAAILNLAHGLHQLAISKNDVVLIFSPNCHVYPICFLAITYIGAVVTTANPLATTKDLSNQIKDCHPKLAITTRGLNTKINGFNLPTLFLDDTSFQNVVNLGASCRNRIHFEVHQNDVACLLYSSGTTGVSKGVVLTHRNFIAGAAAYIVEKEFAGEDRDRVYVCFLPMFHVLGLAAICYGQLACGNTVVTMARFEIDALLRCVEKYRVTDVSAVPPVILALVESKSVVDYDLSSLRKITSGAAPLGKDLMDQCALVFPGVSVTQGYGMTESCGIISLEYRTTTTPTGSVGTLIAGVEAKVISIETDEPLPPNNQGEICIRGANIMRGYLNNAQATKQTIDEDQWLHTGDLGYIDDTGNLYIVDRIKELIKYKGFQVAPAELEAMLLQHADLLDAVVIPYPDEEAGEVPAAYVVRKAKSTLKEDEVKKFINEQVTPYKRLRHVFFIKAVPKSASGKILRRQLIQKARSKI